MKLARTLTASVVIGLMASSGFAMTKEEHKAAKDRISADYKMDKEKCDAMSDNAKDICMKEAKGREDVAKAELEAQYKPSARNTRKVADARADAAYAVAKEKCDDLKGNEKDVCEKDAKAAQVKAKEDAKVAAAQNQPVNSTNTAVNPTGVNTTATGATGAGTAGMGTAADRTANATAARNANVAEARKDAAEEKNEANYKAAKERCDALSGDAKSKCVDDAKRAHNQK